MRPAFTSSAEGGTIEFDVEDYSFDEYDGRPQKQEVRYRSNDEAKKVMVISGASRLTSKNFPEKSNNVRIPANNVAARTKLEFAIKQGFIFNEELGQINKIKLSNTATASVGVDGLSARIGQVVLNLIKSGRISEDDAVDLNDVRAHLVSSDNLTRAYMDNECWRIALWIASAEIIFDKNTPQCEIGQSIGFLNRSIVESAFLDSVLTTAQGFIDRLEKGRYVFPIIEEESGDNWEVIVPNYLAVWNGALPNRIYNSKGHGKAHVTYPICDAAVLKTVFFEDQNQLMLLHSSQIREFGAGYRQTTHGWVRTALNARSVKTGINSESARRNSKLCQKIGVTPNISGTGFKDDEAILNVDFYNHPHSDTPRKYKHAAIIFTMPAFPTHLPDGGADFMAQYNSRVPKGRARKVLVKHAFDSIVAPYLEARNLPASTMPRREQLLWLTKIFTEIEQRALEILAAM